MNRKGFCTKYCLTQGIFQVDVAPNRGDPDSKYVYVRERPGTVSVQLVIGRDFFESSEAAITNAREQAWNKLASLKRQILALEQLAKKPKWADKPRKE